MTDLKSKIMNELSDVMDPELNISITDLGLIYDIVVDKKKNAHITMTLTTIGCPLFPLIENQVKSKLKLLGLKEIEVELTFDPPWTMNSMSERAKAMLGM